MKGAFKILNRHLKVFARTWQHNLMFNVIEPLLYLSAMGFGLGAFVQQIDGMSYIQFIAPGMVALSSMYSATFECTYGTFVRLHYQKAFQALLAGPVTVKDVVIGEILYATFKSVVFGAVILLVVTALGQIKSIYALLIPLFLILPGILFSTMALCYTGVTSNIDYINYYITLAIMPFFLFGGLYFPVSALPVWVQKANLINPLFHSVEVCRALALGQLSDTLWLHVLTLAVFAIILLPLPIKLMTKKLIS
ncbi:ABC transporter permease [Dendrosporobacter sp. 1207_IL3150]|uniref:ABC transporter permease n=1 Tax=Dendrosporobacter sp. 1207_IL3150 TaxID=3084054 RepID=UPI002FD9574F